MSQFKFYDLEESRAGLVGRENDLVSDDVLRDHTDPFFNECRAYGRLEEKKLNGTIAVRCYGYITVPAEKEELLQRKFQVWDWDRPGHEYNKPARERQPFRAIVKELILADIPLTGKVADKILRDLRRMRRCGVYPGDVQPRNYKAGLLVDLSVAMTEPYYLFKIRAAWQVEMIKNDELNMWEAMVQEHQLKTRLKAVRNDQYCKRLRPRKAKRKINPCHG
jgi:Kinetochore Sim4 complex subunit FTA2